jgi:hypothetical protein
MAYGRLVVVVIAVSFPACGPSASSTGAGTYGIPDASGHCSGAYAASGGDPTGTWSVVSACIEGDPAALMNAHSTSACPNVVRGFTVEQASGMATLGAGAITSNDASVIVRQDRVMTSTCHAAVNATPIRAQSDCDNYASSLITAVRFAFDSSCTYENDGCTCWIKDKYTLEGSTYQAAQNQLTVGQDVFPYGVAGDVFTARVSLYETSGIQVRLQRVTR